eukprot:IDg7376t1
MVPHQKPPPGESPERVGPPNARWSVSPFFGGPRVFFERNSEHLVLDWSPLGCAKLLILGDSHPCVRERFDRDSNIFVPVSLHETNVLVSDLGGSITRFEQRIMLRGTGVTSANRLFLHRIMRLWSHGLASDNRRFGPVPKDNGPVLYLNRLDRPVNIVATEDDIGSELVDDNEREACNLGRDRDRQPGDPQDF